MALGCKVQDIGLAGCVAELLIGHIVQPAYTLDGSEDPGVKAVEFFLLETWSEARSWLRKEVQRQQQCCKRCRGASKGL